MKTKIFVTGGTFDKVYDEITGTLYFKESHIHQILALGRCKINVDIETLMLIDSLKMTDKCRNLIAKFCNHCDIDKIVITHGTDTMTDTGRFLLKIVKNKTIVLTGAMIPITFGSSDGLFNLGGALAFAQTLPHGVYIAMNGRYYHCEKVLKNKFTGVFEEVV